ncbi:MAG: glycosyltransferase family 2 protein [Chthoniobacteraceae bacterium]|nr:glycosyltransferase family 2 protein [Chthoniobacteraceae bacterium]
MPQGRFETLPKVTVQLPVFNELYVVERLLNAVAALDYPRDLLQIQVLDDSTDETCLLAETGVKQLREQGFNVQYIHRTDRTGFKAGALENGLQTCDGEFILILDADFVPKPNLLRDTIHYFTNPKVGMVQSRWGHINRDYSMLTRIQAMFLDGHLVLEQTARSRAGRFINFNGTGGLWRRSCIVASGGWQHDTLTEDLDLSYRAQLGGWKFLFLKDLVTPAELPVDMNGFRSQQHRWTKGSIQTCKKILGTVWRSQLPLLVKVEATVHLTSNFAYLLLVFLCILLQEAPKCSDLLAGPWRAVLFDIPVFLFACLSAVIFYAVAQRENNPKRWMRELPYMPLLLALGIGMSISNAKAVLEAVFNHESEFTRTPKYGIERKKQRWSPKKYRALKSALPFVELGFAIYFTYFMVSAALEGQWFSLPFLALFQGGFSYVAWTSISQWLPRWETRTADEAVTA